MSALDPQHSMDPMDPDAAAAADLVRQLTGEVEELQDANEQLENANDYLQNHNRDLRIICAVLTYLNGRDVGMGSFQVRLPADVAFAVRSKLPASPHVVMSYEDGELGRGSEGERGSGGAMVITVV